MPDTQAIIGLPGFKILSVVHTNPLIFEVYCEIKPSCPHCGAKDLRTKDSFLRKLRHESFGVRPCRLEVRVHKYHCLGCRKYFNERLPGVAPYARATEPFKREVCTKHEQGISQRTLQLDLGIGNATVERWYHAHVDLKSRELMGRACPQILGIDEHFFTKKQGFATTFVDLKSHRVFDVVLGRSELSLRGFLSKLKGRDQVRIVVMDLSETYRSIVKKYFPNAMIVADRFHVVKLFNHHFLKVWGELDPKGKKSRGLLSLIRRHEWNLKEEQVPKIQNYFTEVQGLEPLYRFKQDLMKLLLVKHQKRSEVKDLIPQLLWHLEELLKSPWQPLKTFGETLKSWLEPIVRMWRFTKNNGITEGLHTKMEMISRRAFGFRNFNNYRLRVIVLCS